jgi:hypothetical protein
MPLTNLEVFCRDLKISERDAMDALQDAGIISDNCTKLADVFGQDQWRAINHLGKHKPKSKSK